MKVAYYQVHVSYQDDQGRSRYHSSVGVVAESAVEAAHACLEGLKQEVPNVKIMAVNEVGDVRFIRHTFKGPNTKVYVEGEEAPGV